MKIALAVDGSGSSQRATQFLVELLGTRSGTEVHVVNVQTPMLYTDLLPAEKQSEIEQWRQQSAEEATAGACKMLAAAKVPFTLHVVAGDPAVAIAGLARERRCELIVMGTRGMGTVAGIVLGSVASKVVHLASVPVTLVK
jgi:nucleotide-binding universal stress UspA family protein